MNDLRYAVRMLSKSPGFTAVAVLTLAFGIAVNTNIFGMVSALFLQPLPVKDGDRLVLLMQRSAAFGLPHGHSFPDFRDYRQRVHCLSDWIAYLPAPVNLSAAGQTAERAWVDVVTPNAFAALGVAPALGRMLLPQDGEAPGASPVAVLSYRCWQRRFGGDPSIVGQTITLNGKLYTVVGVAPEYFRSFSWSMAMSAFVPVTMMPDLLEQRGAPAWRIMARLKPGVSLREARTEAGMVAQQLAKDFPAEHKDAKLLVIRETSARPDPTFADFMPVFAVFFTGMVALVLFIACANVANLMLARALARQREMVVRAAIGANRWQLVRQVLAESLLLAALAGVVGFVVAGWAGRALQGFTPSGDIPLNLDHSGPWHVYVFTVGISLLAGLLSGLGPALQTSRFNLFASLKEGSGGRVALGKHHFRDLLVVGQVTLSLVVLICGGLFFHSLQRVKRLEVGFRPDNLLMMSLDLGLQGYSDDRGRTFQHDLLERVRALPGVTAASFTQHVPFDYSVQVLDLAPDDPPSHFKDGTAMISFSRVEHTFLRTMGIPLLRGRDFTADDGPASTRVAVVNEALARACWPGRDPLGRRFRFGHDGDWIEVIGVVPTGKYVMLSEDAKPFFYVPLAQHYASPISLAVRTAGDPAPLITAVRDTVRALDHDLPVYNVRTMREHMQTSVFALLPLRMGATMAGVQGIIGLFLAVMGLYAVVAYAVNQRTQEIGIRIALGAQSLDVVRFIVRDGVRLTLVGSAIGLVLATGIAFGLSRVLYGVTALDPSVFFGVTALLLGTAALACYLPARRATRVDPVVALRYE